MTEVSTINVDEPMDLMKLSLNKTIFVKCRYNHEIKGKLHVKKNSNRIYNFNLIKF